MSDLAARQHDGPVDDVAKAALAEQGLDLRLLPNVDAAGFAGWLQAVARGFHDGERTEAQIEASRDHTTQRRLVGVYDAATPDPMRAVATFASWVGELTVPGGRGIPSLAVSAVTVAPTHRRRGVLRAMMEGELRRADALGVPVAMLTASESAIYGRFGFAAAAMSAHVRIDVPRAHWAGPRPGGRVDFVSRERLRELAPALHERVRLGSPGEVEMPMGHWDRFAGTRPDAEHADRLRAVQYADADGVHGVALYSIEENHADFARAKVRVHLLVAATADAYAALWRFLLELDLVGELTASELSVDEPLLWMIADRRAAKVTVQDHQYVRILDVPAALTARRYAAPATIALQVSDPLGFAAGGWIVRVGDDGRAAVEPWHEGMPVAGPLVRLGVAELSALYLGSVPFSSLVVAGRAESTDPAAAARLFAWPEPARLSFWY